MDSSALAVESVFSLRLTPTIMFSIFMKYLSVLFLFLIVMVSISEAQPPPPALPSGPDQAPIDGGLSLLALGGGAYALNKLRNRNKKAD